MTDRIHRNGSVPDWLAELQRLQADTPRAERHAKDEVRVNVNLWDERTKPVTGPASPGEVVQCDPTPFSQAATLH